MDILKLDSKRKFANLLLLLSLSQRRVQSGLCPATCRCVFNDILEKNKASCTLRESTVDIKWYQILGHPILSITCKGSSYYRCQDLPNFNTMHEQAWLEVKSCAPNIVRCAKSIYAQPTVIENMETHEMSGQYSREDLEGLDKVWYVRLYFTDADKTMPTTTIDALPSIKELYIKGGDIQLSKHNYKTQLEYLELNDNKIYDIPSDVFKGLASLKKLYIFGNNMTYISDGAFNGLVSLEELNLRDNMIKYLAMDRKGEVALSELLQEPKPPKKLLKLFQNAASLREINLSKNQISTVPEKTFSKMEKLEKLYLSYNNIENLTGNIFTLSSKLTEIHLDHNNMIHLELDIFHGLKLQTLNLAFNKLRRIALNKATSFQTTTLNLSNNNFEMFEDSFVEMTDMIYLDLSGNNIKMLKETDIKYSNPNLIIDLRYSNIARIIPDTGKTEAKGNVTLYLSHNTLECDCTTTKILNKWHQNGLLIDFQDIVCYQGKALSNIDIHVYCNESHALVALVGLSTIATFIILIILIALYANRNKIGQHLSFIKQSSGPTSFEMTQYLGKIYDVYVSFANHDLEFVYDKLLPTLEDKYNQKVYFRHHDSIEEILSHQILQNIQKAALILVVLTKHYLLSSLACLEFKTADDLRKQEGMPKVILVLLDKSFAKDKNLDIDINSYITANNYLQWGDRSFWKDLQKQLPKYVKTK